MGTRRQPPARRRQRGVALITAVLVVALATLLATDLLWDSQLNRRRAVTLLTLDQAVLYALGAESWAVEILRLDAEESDIDHLGEEWAFDLPPLPIEGGLVEGRLVDLQGRFNVNNLIGPEGGVDPVALQQFERLLEQLGLDPKWAALMGDWVDADIETSFPYGAEDDIYTGFDPPYRTANGPVTSVSELLALSEIDPNTYETLREHLAALPAGTRLNVCTASAALLQALSEDTEDLARDPESLAEERQDDCYPRLEDAQQVVEPEFSETLSETSSYFLSEVTVSIGTTELTLYSLLERGSAGGGVRPILRSFGSY